MSPKLYEADRTLLGEWFMNVESPIIISAPMLGFSNGSLAAAVSRAGGLGFIPGAYDLTAESGQLARLEVQLTQVRKEFRCEEYESLGCGVGFLTFDKSWATFAETALPLLVKHRVPAAWLFAPRPHENGGSGHADAVRALKAAGIRVFVQVGTVAAAREAVADGADVLVAQGIDAGGHQFRRGAGVISLVPEVVAMVEEMGKENEVAVVAAGGIADGRAVAGVLAMGAQGAVMGTRFLVAQESWAPEWQKKQLLEAKDGGTATVKTPFFDDLQNMNVWPDLYDGRALISSAYDDHIKGMGIEENIAKYKAAQEAGDTSRRITWCGTGVGLVKDLEHKNGAYQIVYEIRNAAKASIRRLQWMTEGMDDDV